MLVVTVNLCKSIFFNKIFLISNILVNNYTLLLSFWVFHLFFFYLVVSIITYQVANFVNLFCF